MRISTLISSVLVAGLLGSPVAARPRASGTRAPSGKIERMVPGHVAGALFLNVKRLYALYGDLIVQDEDYARVRAVVARRGLPDPEKDVDSIGIFSNLESKGASAVGAVMTGRADLKKFLGIAESSSGAQWITSIFRGVTFYTSVVDGQNLRVGAADESTLAVSLDQTGAHPHSRAIVRTLSGSVPSFAAVHKLTLPAGWLMHASVQVPAELQAQGAAALAPQFEPVSHIQLASVSAVAAEITRRARISLTLTCDTRKAAHALHEMVAGFASAFTAGSPGGPADIVARIKMKVSGTSLTMDLDLPRSMLSNVLGTRRSI